MERQLDLQGYKVQRGFYQVERQILTLRKLGDFQTEANTTKGAAS